MTGSCDRWPELPLVGVGDPARSSMFWGPSRADRGVRTHRLLSSRPHPSGQSLLLPPPLTPSRGAPRPSWDQVPPRGRARFCRTEPALVPLLAVAAGSQPLSSYLSWKGAAVMAGPGRVGDGVCPRVGPWGGAALLKEGGRAAAGSRPSPSSRAPHAEMGSGHRR